MDLPGEALTREKQGTQTQEVKGRLRWGIDQRMAEQKQEDAVGHSGFSTGETMQANPRSEGTTCRGIDQRMTEQKQEDTGGHGGFHT